MSLIDKITGANFRIKLLEADAAFNAEQARRYRELFEQTYAHLLAEMKRVSDLTKALDTLEASLRDDRLNS